MGHDVLVSIIIPVFDMGEQLNRCIKSVREQTYRNLEIILINDGSTDKTTQICQILQKEDTRIIVRNQKNNGAGSARNVGLEVASGKYVYFQDADDLLRPKAIEKLTMEMETGEGYDLIVFGYYAMDGSNNMRLYSYTERVALGDELRDNYEHSVDMGALWAIQGVLCNKFFSMNLIRQYGICFPNLRRNEDEVFIMRYMDKVCKVKFLPDILYEYYTNCFYKSWQKYPMDYYKVVFELQDCYMNIVYPWNRANKKVLEKIDSNIRYNMIISLKILFRPRNGLNLFTRYRKVKEICEQYRKTLPGMLKNFSAENREYQWLREGKALLLYLKIWKNVMSTHIKEVL